jgi:hypothetical protein
MGETRPMALPKPGPTLWFVLGIRGCSVEIEPGIAVPTYTCGAISVATLLSRHHTYWFLYGMMRNNAYPVNTCYSSRYWHDLCMYLGDFTCNMNTVEAEIGDRRDDGRIQRARAQ